MRDISDEDLHQAVVNFPYHPEAVGGIGGPLRAELRRRVATKLRLLAFTRSDARSGQLRDLAQRLDQPLP